MSLYGYEEYQKTSSLSLCGIECGKNVYIRWKISFTVPYM